ncbi:MAG: DUF2461 domain-containing protein [Gemmatimonas sp.]|jgi:uncharacterized protein (TIGR02453 family)|uniref:DUF2461 domain-containing protein n=1 Tax=Gemmatimonas sp. TaxID=1962908 RepID=UPI00391EF190|nr:DUF2461 domain-containing protein [Gemmatimonadota bacterium]
MDSFTRFSPKAFTFLRGIAKHNRKEWFEAHRDTYEQELKRPLSALIEEMDVHLATIAPEIIGSPKKSVFRIHRDVRFSKDKSPYKTNVACWFFHRDVGTRMQTEAVHGGAGFYLHIQPGACFCGGGIWMPPRPALAKIRQALVDDLEGWEAIVTNRAFRRRFGDLDTEGMLTRLPRGYDADHPAGAWLRYQSFTAGTPLTEEEVLSPKLPHVLARHYAAMTPFVRWLNTALGLAPAAVR